MKKIILSLFIGSLSLSYAQSFQAVALLQSGSNAKRINIAVLGDGFTSSELSAFQSSAQNTINYLFTKSPYTEYKNYFNAYAIKVVSAQSGVKHPGTATDVAEPAFPVANPNNYFSSSFDNGVHRCYYGNTTKVTQVLAASLPDFDVAYVLGNTNQYGGCGGTYAFASLNSAANEIVVHELGHSFGNLADEYWFSGTGESANKTQVSNPSAVKWKNWVGINGVGVYPHAESPSWYRPHQSCEMRYLNQQFCSVCKEAIIERIHSLVSPVDSYTPANSSSVNANANVTFTVNEILPVPNTLVNSWKLNGNLLSATGNSVTISPGQLNSGNNTLLFSVTDNTALIKVNNHSTVHFANVSWTLNKSASKTSEVRAVERRFAIYPNPADHEFYIKGKQDFSKDVKVILYNAAGRLIAVKSELKDATTVYVDIRALPAGTYVLNVEDHDELVISQKIAIE